MLFGIDSNNSLINCTKGVGFMHEAFTDIIPGIAEQLISRLVGNYGLIFMNLIELSFFR